MYYVYIIETEDHTYYTGQTNDLSRRLGEHISGGPKSALYFRIHKPQFLVHVEEFLTRSEAMNRERVIKRNHRLKLQLIGERRDLHEIVGC